MSCSGLRYARELDDVRSNILDYGEIKLIRGAVIDVWYNYPRNASTKNLYPSKYPLHKLDNIIMSPHASAWSHQLWERRFNFICENLENLNNNRRLKNIVSKT